MTRPTDGEDENAKTQALRASGALNLHPEKVSDPLFHEGKFFDPRDLVLVKYEMLRRVQVEGWPVAQAVRTFGFSRPVFYHALAAWEAEGLPGLIPKRPGPKGAHKLSTDVLHYLDELLAQDPRLRSEELARRVLEKFRLSVHSRSIERALARRKKGRSA
jgi:transposase